MSGPFGVDLPDNLNSLSTESAPEVSSAGGSTDKAPTVESQETATPQTTDSLDKPQTPEMVELDKLERFRFQGRDMTPKELRDQIMMRDAFTRNSQQVAEARKYADNFAADLAVVIENPERLEEMRRLYPPDYIKAAERALAREKQRSEGHSEQAEYALPEEVTRRLEKLDELTQWKATVDERVQQANEARSDQELESWFTNCAKKFESADMDVVNVKALALAEQLEAQGKKFSEKDLEKLFKADHDFREKKFEERYSQRFKTQKAAATKATDMGAGGGVPSTPALKPRTMKEATAQALADAEAGRL